MIIMKGILNCQLIKLIRVAKSRVKPIRLLNVIFESNLTKCLLFDDYPPLIFVTI